LIIEKIQEKIQNYEKTLKSFEEQYRQIQIQKQIIISNNIELAESIENSVLSKKDISDTVFTSVNNSSNINIEFDEVNSNKNEEIIEINENYSNNDEYTTEINENSINDPKENILKKE
jgi:hypothetical protein